MYQFYSVIVAVLMAFGFLVSQAFVGPDTFINGAGASFPYPIYSKWIKNYHQQNPEVKINYQSIGSGGGIRQVIQGTVDFGASDAPMNEHEVERSKYEILHLPMVLGAVALTYNLPELKSPLKLTHEVLVAIYLGEIKYWDHPKLVALNPDLKGLTTYIMPVRRADGSGTTAVFTDYLSKASAIWKNKVGQGKSLKWPTGLGGKGNEGVTGLVKQNHGALGYVELSYAFSSGLPVAHLQNASGNFIKPSLEAVSQSADGVKIPDDYRVSITNSPNPQAYPISAFTYMLLPANLELSKVKVFTEFLSWTLVHGQKMAPALKYARLPETLVRRVQETLNQVQKKD